MDISFYVEYRYFIVLQCGDRTYKLHVCEQLLRNVFASALLVAHHYMRKWWPPHVSAILLPILTHLQRACCICVIARIPRAFTHIYTHMWVIHISPVAYRSSKPRPENHNIARKASFLMRQNTHITRKSGPYICVLLTRSHHMWCFLANYYYYMLGR